MTPWMSTSSRDEEVRMPADDVRLVLAFEAEAFREVGAADAFAERDGAPRSGVVEVGQRHACWRIRKRLRARRMRVPANARREIDPLCLPGPGARNGIARTYVGHRAFVVGK